MPGILDLLGRLGAGNPQAFGTQSPAEWADNPPYTAQGLNAAARALASPLIAGANLAKAAMTGEYDFTKPQNLPASVYGDALQVAMLPMGTGAIARVPIRAGEQVLDAGPIRRTPPLPMDEASRLARADAIGFRRDMPLQFGTAPEGELVGPAAVDVNGRIFTGTNHGVAMLKAQKELGLPFEQMQWGPIWDGYMTSAGRYVSRREAAEIAARSGQGSTRGIFGASRGLASEDLVPGDAVGRPGVQIAATQSGLPGGAGGFRGVADVPVPSLHTPGLGPGNTALPKGPPGSGATGAEATLRQRAEHTALPKDPPGSGSTGAQATLWHRADRRLEFDATGLQEPELQTRLLNAWDQGHDAVLLRNYIRPGATRPETVIVVRDPNQLRSPDAAFDPAKKLDTNILAALAGVGFIAADQLPIPSQQLRSGRPEQYDGQELR